MTDPSLIAAVLAGALALARAAKNAPEPIPVEHDDEPEEDA